MVGEIIPESRATSPGIRKPGIVDTYVLVYALDADASQHAAARDLLEAARADASTTLFVTSQILCEFYASTRTTQLYDRRRDEVSLDEVERIVI